MGRDRHRDPRSNGWALTCLVDDAPSGHLDNACSLFAVGRHNLTATELRGRLSNPSARQNLRTVDDLIAGQKRQWRAPFTRTSSSKSPGLTSNNGSERDLRH